jgi:hypothetical protein
MHDHEPPTSADEREASRVAFERAVRAAREHAREPHEDNEWCADCTHHYNVVKAARERASLP